MNRNGGGAFRNSTYVLVILGMFGTLVVSRPGHTVDAPLTNGLLASYLASEMA